MMDYGRTAAERGLKVIIAGTGGAAHLPGMVASTTVPCHSIRPFSLKYCPTVLKISSAN